MKKKKYIILILVFVCCIGLLFGYNFIKELNSIYIIFPDSRNLKYNGEWNVIENEEIPNYKFDILNNGNIVANSKVIIEENEISFENIEFINNMLAIKGNGITNIIYEVSTLNSEDYNYLNNILRNNGINIEIRNLALITKYLVDINNDSIKETIYTVTNNYDYEIGELFSITILKEKNEILFFDKFEDEYSSYVPTIYFVDLKNDKNADLIIKKTYSSMLGQSIELLNFNNDLSYNLSFGYIHAKVRPLN